VSVTAPHGWSRPPAAHLTEPVLTRSRRLLPLIASRHAGGTPQLHLARVVLPVIGGRRNDLDTALSVLHHARLVTGEDGRCFRTLLGDQVAKAARRTEHAPFALALLRAGLLEEQVLDLLRELAIDHSGAECLLPRARSRAPQLVSVLAILPGARLDTHLRLDVATLAEIESAWSTWTIPPMALPGSPEERQQIGDLAELYSLNLERSAYLGASRDVLWVSRDDYTAGYDIEAGQPGQPRRRIEVKGSRGTDTSFILSVNEWNKAAQYGAQYEIHFWSSIRLGVDPAIDYQRLRGQGQPLVIADPRKAFSGTSWELSAIAYRVKRT
jgi:hypothetical protein